MNNVAIVNESPVSVVGESGTPEPAPYQRTRITALENMTVRSSLWLAFASVLLGAVVIGVFSLFQMGRLNASTHVIYEQEYTGGQAAEQVREIICRESGRWRETPGPRTRDGPGGLICGVFFTSRPSEPTGVCPRGGL